MAATFARTVDILKAVAEPTRLRLLLLLARQELTVSDLTTILGQSQPRVSRHLKLLTEAGLVHRHQEGAFAFFRLGDEAPVHDLLLTLGRGLDDPEGLLAGDTERLGEVRHRRAERAAAYFAENAAQWDRIRSFYVPDAVVERELSALLGEEPLGAVLDVGTGTGRLLELLAPRAERAVGIDASREMLQIARAKLDVAGLAQASVRQGDAYRLPVARGSFDLVTIHQVLHYLDDPGAAVREAAGVLRPGGRLLIVDFAPHEQEFLRDHAHQRLGFSPETLAGFLRAAGFRQIRLRELPPANGRADHLTVLLVLAEREREGAAPSSNPSMLAAAQEP
ncbi:metalloregulator ArsR/SmtB family transcription factor [Aureimonas sp. AU4]|uniref:ArsR/SmtB family transcription factor n=1 Tax=Aureimonas sp. AU4 TaxID=1638163 RepID=UPI0007808369|nr:metalloregulator ArsR/SmtB family transcription factor [Aureimonas sp. AU4]